MGLGGLVETIHEELIEKIEEAINKNAEQTAIQEVTNILNNLSNPNSCLPPSFNSIAYYPPGHPFYKQLFQLEMKVEEETLSLVEWAMKKNNSTLTELLSKLAPTLELNNTASLFKI